MNLHATWDRSRRHTDRESLLSPDEESPILSWDKVSSSIWPHFVIASYKGIITSSIIKNIWSSDKVICSLYSSISTSDSGISVSWDIVSFSNSNKIKVSLNFSCISSSNNTILGIWFYSMGLPTQDYNTCCVIGYLIVISNNCNRIISRKRVICSVKERRMFSFFI